MERRGQAKIVRELHNLRHSLSNWLVNNVKTVPKTVQCLLRHSPTQTSPDLYT
jgi:integrase